MPKTSPRPAHQQASRSVTTPPKPELTANRPWLLVFGQAAVVFGPQNAMRWMKRPCLALENQVPAELAKTPAGRKQVLAELVRIEHGIVA
jgi:uncharacterized protein (DUF2384 family)